MSKENLPVQTGDLLKGEALPLSRRVVKAAAGTKAGQLVKYPLRSSNPWLVALSDEVNGEVVVQPHNCVINLEHVAESEITGKKVNEGAAANMKVEEFIAAGDAYGIVYVGTPHK
jgi:putative pilus assembly secretion protein